MSILSKLFGLKDSAADGWIEVPELAALLASAAPRLVIDVRGPDEFSGPLGHIEGAINIPLADLPNQIPDLSARADPVVMVCHTDRRSSAAAAQLRAAGTAGVTVLRGGMVAWRLRHSSSR